MTQLDLWHEISIITVTINRISLPKIYESVNQQTWTNWHHYVLGDGVQPIYDDHPQRSILGFSRSMGAEEPGRNMPDGTPNPLLRWALQHLDLGRHVCFLDDDNIFLPTFLEDMHRAMQQSPEAGIALCPAIDSRYALHQMDGYPEYGRCDNSALMVRADLARQIGYPRADMTREVNQDYEFVKLCADRAGWIRVGTPLIIFGKYPNTPPLRGNIKVVYSWSLPIEGQQHLIHGNYKQAIACFEQAIEIDPNDAWSCWHLGVAYCYMEEPELAKTTWRQWLNLVDRQDTIRTDWLDYCRGLAHYMLHNQKVAFQYFQRALDLVDNEASVTEAVTDASFNQALYCLALGDMDSSRMLYTHISLKGNANLLAEALEDLRFLKRLMPIRARQIDHITKHLEAMIG